MALAITRRAGSAGRIAASAGKVRIVPPPATELIAAATAVTAAIKANDGREVADSISKRGQTRNIIRLVSLYLEREVLFPGQFFWGSLIPQHHNQLRYIQPRKKDALRFEE